MCNNVQGQVLPGRVVEITVQLTLEQPGLD